jgi:hypothetical protein
MKFEMSEAQAVALFDSGLWREMTPRVRAVFQAFTDRLCMPFEEFQKAVEETLRRSIFTHEFAFNRNGIADELCGLRAFAATPDAAASVSE